MKSEPQDAFGFRLALALGYPHPRYLRRELTSHDIAEWMAYERIEPFGSYQDHIMFAQIAAETFNAGHKESRTVYDYLPGGKPAQTADEQMSTIRALLGR